MYFHWRNERGSRLKLTLLRVTARITRSAPPLRSAPLACLRVRNSQAERKKALPNNELPRDGYLYGVDRGSFDWIPGVMFVKITGCVTRKLDQGYLSGGKFN